MNEPSFDEGPSHKSLSRRAFVFAVGGLAALCNIIFAATGKRVRSLPLKPRNKFSDFPSSFKGPVFRPSDAGYAEVKHLWNRRRSDQMPALIVRATDPDDVVVAVDYATGKNVSIAVRGGGHGIECFAMADDALVLDLSLMKVITVDPATGTTTAQAGVLLGELAAATEKHGYVVPAGTVSTVGVGGLTLGGGIGHLTRRFGATIDNLLSVDVVTMDGRKLTASKHENEELFWGLRGAGQNLAIATSFTFQGHRLNSVISRDMIYAPGDAMAVLVGLNDAMARSRRELSITSIVQHMPPIPGLPKDLIGQVVVLAAVTYTGPAEQFESAMREARRLPAPMMEMEGPSTWVGVSSAIDSWMPAGRRWYNGGGYLPEISHEVAKIALESVAQAPPGCELHIPIMGGALHDFAEDSAAFSRAGANWMYEITAQWDSPSSDKEYMSWVDTLGKKLAPHTLSNGYINLNPYRGPAGLQALYGSPEKWQRIVKLKQTWDPNNRLCYNKNIRPVVTATQPADSALPPPT